MGHALADRLLDDGHQVSVWHRTPGQTQAGFLCPAYDYSTFDVATPQGQSRTSWGQTPMVNTGTIAPGFITALARACGNRLVVAQGITETKRVGRAARVQDAVLLATLRESPVMPTGLRNRVF
jgi:hypothetical protein